MSYQNNTRGETLARNNNRSSLRNGETNRLSAGLFPTILDGAPLSRGALIGLLLVVALLAFEIFNFDTTQFALADLLGETSFFGVRWATILAVAFGAIDFAGLAYLMAPDRGRDAHGEVWYLMGAWMLGATMNALMTWWAVSLTLLNHELGNEVLGRAELIQIAPVFVAVLVWLTRILFIGAFSAAGGYLFGSRRAPMRPPVGQPLRETRAGSPARAKTPASQSSGTESNRFRSPPIPGTSRRERRKPAMPGRRQPLPVAALRARSQARR